VREPRPAKRSPRASPASNSTSAPTPRPALAHVGTRDSSRDIDVIRAALGEDTLSYIGYSYGTRLGWAYAERFPDRVRALVLDGAVAPDQDRYTRDVNQYKAFQAAFDTMAAVCAQQTDCPLGTDPTQATARYHALVLPLETQPIHSLQDPNAWLSYDDVISRTIAALYLPTHWDPLITALRDLAAGNPDTMLALPAEFAGDVAGGPTATPLQVDQNAFDAITCVDEPAITDRATNDRFTNDMRAARPFSDDGRDRGPTPLGLCAFWPVPPTSQPHTLAITGLPPTVVVSTTDDPATPYQAGVDLAHELHATLITYRGTQHTIALTGKSHCVDDPVVAYLTDLTVPRADHPC